MNDDEPTFWIIDATRDDWRDVVWQGKPDHLVVRMKLGKTADGLSVEGVNVERRDGRAVTVRDLRAVRLPPKWFLWDAAGKYIDIDDRTRSIRASGRGRPLLDDKHFRAVWDLYLDALQVAPRSPISWMLTRRNDASDATMRRWVKAAKARATEAGWPAGVSS